MIITGKIKGVLYAVISSATFGFIPFFSIPLLNSGTELDSICFYRFFFSAIMMGAYMSLKKMNLKLTKKEFIPVFIISAFYASTSIFLIDSYRYIPSGISTTIHFLYPVLVTSLMVVFFKEKLSRSKFMAIIMSIAGVFLLCGGISGISSGNGINIIGLTLALITVATYSIYIVGVNEIPVLMNMKGMKMTFYVLSCSAFFFLCNIIVKGEEFSVLETGSQWWSVLGLAFFSTLISNLSLIYAIQSIGSTTTAILGCMEPLTAVAIGFTAFGERLDTGQGTGMIIIFIAVYLVILSQKKYGN